MLGLEKRAGSLGTRGCFPSDRTAARFRKFIARNINKSNINNQAESAKIG
jgi:hypothetical protein